MSRAELLRTAVSLVKTHGFSREALAESVLFLPGSQAHTEPLNSQSVSALFGQGNLARTTLIRAWLDDGIEQMQTVSSPTIRRVLHARLKHNEPVVQYLPEAFALLSTTSSSLPVDPFPGMKHVATVADEACHISGDTSLQLAWYAKRASIAAVYSAAELHQLTSPATAPRFLDSLLDQASSLQLTISEASLYSSYIASSWTGILKSKGFL
ncbi:hypothetical protein C8J56DRAFT_930922 [Mycena floridula]|nr:hypothetical protein C8J56DRAFT_930922 [Mycena floridula]